MLVDCAPHQIRSLARWELREERPPGSANPERMNSSSRSSSSMFDRCSTWKFIAELIVLDFDRASAAEREQSHRDQIADAQLERPQSVESPRALKKGELQL